MGIDRAYEPFEFLVSSNSQIGRHGKRPGKAERARLAKSPTLAELRAGVAAKTGSLPPSGGRKYLRWVLHAVRYSYDH